MDNQSKHPENVRRKPTHYEANEQKTLFEWASYASCTRPELNLLYHIPNGGSRNRLEAANLKKQGVKSGVPDICLPVARGKYHGLYIEMKHGKNSTSEKQEEWIAALREQGYAAVICYGWVPARETLIKYLSMEVQKHE